MNASRINPSIRNFSNLSEDEVDRDEWPDPQNQRELVTFYIYRQTIKNPINFVYKI